MAEAFPELPCEGNFCLDLGDRLSASLGYFDVRWLQVPALQQPTAIIRDGPEILDKLNKKLW